MTSTTDALLDAHALRRIATINRALVGWEPGGEHFDRAVEHTVEHHGYAAQDVTAQLLHVARERCSAEPMTTSLELELAGVPLRGRAPREVLQLVASTVPGLAMESVLVAYALSARSQVRPSRDETVLGHFLAHAAPLAPALVGSLDLVEEIRWSTPDAAIVYGSDETVALVRERMGDRPVAAYGTREGIAVVTPGAPDGWAEALANDILTFRQRGCMSPSHLFMLGDDRARDQLTAQLRTAMVERLPAHVPASDSGVSARSAADDEALGEIACGTSITVGPATVRLHRATSTGELASQVKAMGPLLQTCVLACSLDERPQLATLLLEAGCLRQVLPGYAHVPSPAWPHDGKGRFAPLLHPSTL